jgi:hypothetical protein
MRKNSDFNKKDRLYFEVLYCEESEKKLRSTSTIGDPVDQRKDKEIHAVKKKKELLYYSTTVFPFWN